MLEHLSDPKLGIIVALLFARLKTSTYRFPFLGIAINLAGTVLHELCHYVAALLLNGKPIGFSLIPRRVHDGWVLGSVESSNVRWYNAFPIAMAPVLLLGAAYYLDVWYGAYIVQPSLLSDLVYILAVVVLVENAIPSLQDFRVALSNIPGAAIYTVIIIFLLVDVIHIAGG
ncbi:hypothetical protein E0765_07410 [Sulfuricurvum sp. IAE1]|uniref:hypothetical protein n=1 Tax=Sulfuricurvum sp. IAE1 TaxID=2546102 RepID=UPI00104A837E|nr:hypothetical protein [Sulfuricurvum sp. IAE1]TDA63654.1 hypothetical protein E0765_07410 [Sulfuricurvum sp. IAE1]